MNEQELRKWIGRVESCEDFIGAAPLRGLWALLDHDIPVTSGTPLPPLAHLLYFLSPAPQSQIDEDGHPKRGGFLPPVPLPRRMWAGGQYEFPRALVVGDKAVRRSEIIDVKHKEGRSGQLVFVDVRHEISGGQGLAIIETHNIVYRDAPQSGATKPPVEEAPRNEEFARDIVPDPVLLFRYSALTFNGHRIHYDHPYTTKVEGYPGLIVHGPLIATLLLDLLHRNVPNATVRRFSFRAVSPLYDIAPFTVCGRAESDKTFTLWARNHEGGLAMKATVEIE